MPHPTPIQIVGTVLFALAIVHTFSTGLFERLADRHPRHAGLLHLAAEVEVVFGLWATLLVLAMALLQGGHAALDYVDGRNFTEPMFVFAVMVIAATRPVLDVAGTFVSAIVRRVPLPPAAAFVWTVLTVVPLLGSFITEPAAMTLAALMLSDRLFARATGAAALPASLRYAILGTLFVNVSIGGTLTPYAAPPVLMVASTWQWDTLHMLAHFGWRSALACAASATLLVLVFRRPLATARLGADGHRGEGTGPGTAVPVPLRIVHVAFLAGVVAFSHHPAVFSGLFLLFLGVVAAYPQHQDRLILREALLVAFFLAGLVVLGGVQQWWLRPVLLSMSADAVYWGATALTAITDNAALTYLGSLVDGLDDAFRHALVAGAVTGGGLTVIANAPNPAGLSILRGHFDDDTVSPLWLLVAALVPTAVAVVAFRVL